MKKLLILLGETLLVMSACAQGTVQLITTGLTDPNGNGYDARLGITPDFPNVTAELFLVNVANNTYTPLFPTAVFNRAGEVGPAEAAVVTVPGISAGQTANLAIAAFVGQDFESAVFKSFWSATFTSAPLGGTAQTGGQVPTPDLSGLRVNSSGVIIDPQGNPLLSFPEPSTIAVGFFGAAVLLLASRRTSAVNATRS